MIRFLCDSTSDLTLELRERYNITLLPFHIAFNEEEHLDGVDISPEDVYRFYDEGKGVPKTRPYTVDEAKAIMKPILDQGDDILAFCTSSKLSKSTQMLKEATSQLKAVDRVGIIDCENASSGIALLLIEASKLINKGKSREEIEGAVAGYASRLKTTFIVDQLRYLQRNGYCSSFLAMTKSVLNQHTAIVIENGELKAKESYRGKLDKAVMSFIEDLKDDLLKAKSDAIFITDSGIEDEIREKVIEVVKNLNHFEKIYVNQTGSAVSAYCGPQALGVAYLEG